MGYGMESGECTVQSVECKVWNVWSVKFGV